MGRRVRSWATLIVAAVLTLLAGLAPAATTTASAETFIYDAQSNARVDAQAFGRAKANPTPLSEVRERTAPRSASPGAPSTTLVTPVVATNTVDDLAAAVSRPAGVADDFVSQAANNGKGTVWRPPGSTGNAGTVRIMEPTAQYPNGYVRFYNEGGQPIGLNGNPGPRSVTHIPLNPDGTYPIPKGWGAG